MADLLYWWPFWARPKQLPPEGDWLVWFLRPGRGFGKTRTGAQYVISRAMENKGPIALVGQTKADVRDTMLELGDSSIIKCSPPNFRPIYESSKRRVLWPNGCVGVLYSGDEPDQLRGPQHQTAWVDELAKFKLMNDTWDNLEMGMRLGDPRIVVTSTPRPLPLIKQLSTDPMTRLITGTSYENIANLAGSYVKRVIQRYENTRLGRQELHGALMDDVEGALWNHGMIEKSRVTKFPTLLRVVVGVDPKASQKADSETGIVVVGLGEDDHLYVLDDLSINGSPNEWGKQVCAAYRKNHSDRIVGEVNNGGDMVEAVIRGIDSRVSYTAVRASRGKAVRAEPVAALYEKGLVHHVGMLAGLEDQMCSWTPADVESPDRMDALVWAIWELRLKKIEDEEPLTARVRIPVGSMVRHRT